MKNGHEKYRIDGHEQLKFVTLSEVHCTLCGRKWTLSNWYPQFVDDSVTSHATKVLNFI